jgi:hypothetical protein
MSTNLGVFRLIVLQFSQGLSIPIRGKEHGVNSSGEFTLPIRVVPHP